MQNHDVNPREFACGSRRRGERDCAGLFSEGQENGSYVSMGLGKTLRHAWLFLVEVVKELEYKSLRLDGDTVPPTLKLKGNEWVSLLAVERT